ncbi:hypothetical protein ABPG75_000410 [Micractinium tetrahymenae]
MAQEEHNISTPSLLHGLLVRFKLGGRYLLRFVELAEPGTAAEGDQAIVVVQAPEAVAVPGAALPVRRLPLTSISGTNCMAAEHYEQLGKAEAAELAEAYSKAGLVLSLAEAPAVAWRKQAALHWHAQHWSLPPLERQQRLLSLLAALANGGSQAAQAQQRQEAQQMQQMQQLGPPSLPLAAPSAAVHPGLLVPAGAPQMQQQLQGLLGPAPWQPQLQGPSFPSLVKPAPHTPLAPAAVAAYAPASSSLPPYSSAASHGDLITPQQQHGGGSLAERFDRMASAAAGGSASHTHHARPPSADMPAGHGSLSSSPGAQAPAKARPLYQPLPSFTRKGLSSPFTQPAVSGGWSGAFRPPFGPAGSLRGPLASPDEYRPPLRTHPVLPPPPRHTMPAERPWPGPSFSHRERQPEPRAGWQPAPIPPPFRLRASGDEQALLPSIPPGIHGSAPEPLLAPALIRHFLPGPNGIVKPEEWVLCGSELYITGLCPLTTAAALQHCLAEAGGTVHSVKIVRGDARGNQAFVVLATAHQAAAVLERLQGHTLGGRCMFLRESRKDVADIRKRHPAELRAAERALAAAAAERALAGAAAAASRELRGAGSLRQQPAEQERWRPEEHGWGQQERGRSRSRSRSRSRGRGKRRSRSRGGRSSSPERLSRAEGRHSRPAKRGRSEGGEDERRGRSRHRHRHTGKSRSASPAPRGAIAEDSRPRLHPSAEATLRCSLSGPPGRSHSRTRVVRVTKHASGGKAAAAAGSAARSRSPVPLQDPVGDLEQCCLQLLQAAPEGALPLPGLLSGVAGCWPQQLGELTEASLRAFLTRRPHLFARGSGDGLVALVPGAAPFLRYKRCLLQYLADHPPRVELARLAAAVPPPGGMPKGLNGMGLPRFLRGLLDCEVTVAAPQARDLRPGDAQWEGRHIAALRPLADRTLR